MINQQTLHGNWNELAGRLREKWGELSGDELEQFKGNAAQLVGFIQRKTWRRAARSNAFLTRPPSMGPRPSAMPPNTRTSMSAKRQIGLPTRPTR